MADDWPNDSDSVLRGLFGNLVAAREAGGGGAVNMWNALQSAATSWASGVLSITSVQPPTEAEIALQAQSLIGNVTIQDMNKYTQLAGQYISAKNNLMALSPEQQILGSEIFTPPWSQTAGNPAIPDRYRIRVLRDITVAGFTKIDRQEWASYELSGPLTSPIDALQAADQLFEQADYNARASINTTVEYSIEQL